MTIGSVALWPLPGETHKSLFVLSTGVMSKGRYDADVHSHGMEDRDWYVNAALWVNEFGTG